MSQSYVDYLVDLLSSWRRVTTKRIFGGHGLYADRQIFAILIEDVLYFKVDGSNRADYEAAGSEPFTYEAKGKRISVSYWRVPVDVLEDESKLAAWAQKSCRASAKVKRKK